MQTRRVNGLLIVAILLSSTAPLYAQRQQENVAKLKADARNLVGIIGSDKIKIQTYCKIEDLSEQVDQAVQQKDSKKARALAEKYADLKKKMGPEFAALVDIEKRVGLNSPDGQEIASIVATLGESCGDGDASTPFSSDRCACVKSVASCQPSNHGCMSRLCRVESPANFGNARKWPETNANKPQHAAT